MLSTYFYSVATERESTEATKTHSRAARMQIFAEVHKVPSCVGRKPLAPTCWNYTHV